MGLYRVADLFLRFSPQYDILRRRSEKFRVSSADHLDIDFDGLDEYLQKKADAETVMTPEQSEAHWIGNRFAWELWRFGATAIHASALVIDGEAVLFSADSGVGKTTHTSRWLKLYGDRAYILDDDRPVIRRKNGVLTAFGTPFSGASDVNANKAVPLKAIVFLERAAENYIRKPDASEVIMLMIKHCGYSKRAENMAEKLALYDEIVKQVPIYVLGCTISDDAVRLVYQTVKENV